MKRIESTATSAILALAVFAAPAGAATSRPAEAEPSVTLATGADAACLAGALRIGGGELHLDFEAADFDLDRSSLCGWVKRAATAVTHYFSRFPVPSVSIVLRPVDGDRVFSGSTWADLKGRGPVIFVDVGRQAGTGALTRDWVLTHEMTHLAVPSVPDRSHWLEEGIATYVEPVARAQLGELSPARIWRDMVDGMPMGLPRAGDRGLDRTPTWGRTYWGGALFCLLADVRIRQRTGGRFGLRDALRAVIAGGGNLQHAWPVARILDTGDRATGTTVLAELYTEMATARGLADLAPLWRDLGVEPDGALVRFDDTAPLAAVRLAITAPDGPTDDGSPTDPAPASLTPEGGRPVVARSARRG